MKKEYGVLYMIIVVAAIIFGPLITIASMNTLFGLTIPYAIETSDELSVRYIKQA